MENLIEIINCPLTHLELKQMNEAELDLLNSQIIEGRITYFDRSSVSEPLENGLIRSDLKVVYAVEKGIPILLKEKGLIVTTMEFDLLEKKRLDS